MSAFKIILLVVSLITNSLAYAGAVKVDQKEANPAVTGLFISILAAIPYISASSSCTKSKETSGTNEGKDSANWTLLKCLTVDHPIAMGVQDLRSKMANAIELAVQSKKETIRKATENSKTLDEMADALSALQADPNL